MSLKLGTMTTKLLPISIEHGEMNHRQLDIQYEGDFKNSVLEMKALKMKKVKLLITDYHFFKYLNTFLNDKTFWSKKVESTVRDFVAGQPITFYQ